MVAGIRGVQIGPGATLLALIPLSASICDRVATMLAIPALVTLYGSSVGGGMSELTEVEPMIAEPGRKCGTAALLRWKIALRLIASVRSHSSSGISSSELRVIWNAALLTSTSTRPNFSTVL